KQSEFYSLCFRSRLVDSLVFFSSNSALPNCNRSGFEGEKLPELGQGLRQKSWTTSVDSLKNYWPSPRKPIQAIIVEEAPFMYSTGTQFILLGGVLAKSQWQWQRALMEVWLTQTVANIGDLERRVLADFFVAVINDRFQAPSMSEDRALEEPEVALDS